MWSTQVLNLLDKPSKDASTLARFDYASCQFEVVFWTAVAWLDVRQVFNLINTTLYAQEWC